MHRVIPSLARALSVLLVLVFASTASAAVTRPDAGLPERCAKQLSGRVVALVCDVGGGARLRVPNRRSGTTIVAAHPMRPGTRVAVTGRLSSRSHVVLRYETTDKTFTARFSRMRSAGGRRQVRITSRLRRGRLEVRATGIGRSQRPTRLSSARKPAVKRRATNVIPPATSAAPSGPANAAPVPAAPAAPAPSAPSLPAANGLRADALTPSGGGGCAVRDTALDADWTRSGPGWTGGDATYSVRLPDGRDLWLFGDTFLGSVRSDGTRPAESPFIRNAGVVRSGDSFETLHTGSAAAPATWLQSSEPGTWYWPGDATVEGTSLRVLVSKMRFTGSGPWNFAHVGTDVVTLSLPDLQVRSVVEHDTSSIRWGAAVLEDGDWTYVYGMEDEGLAKHAHVARVPRDGLTGAWEYRTANGWSTQAHDSARIHRDVSEQFSVLARRGEYLLVSQVSMFSGDIRVARSSSPSGGWGTPKTVYTTPAWTPSSFTYNALAHPQLSRDGDLVVSYNVNSFDGSELHSKADAYRPRFLRVPAECL